MNTLEIDDAIRRLKPGVGFTHSINLDVLSITMHDGSSLTQAAVEADIDANGGLVEVRIERDSLLAQSDWTQMPDSPLSDSDKGKWATYRTKLRELPAQSKIVFPDAP